MLRKKGRNDFLPGMGSRHWGAPGCAGYTRTWHGSAVEMPTFLGALGLNRWYRSDSWVNENQAYQIQQGRNDQLHYGTQLRPETSWQQHQQWLSRQGEACYSLGGAWVGLVWRDLTWLIIIFQGRQEIRRWYLKEDPWSFVFSYEF